MTDYIKKILLVDDDPADRALFARRIRKLGFEVVAVGTAEAAMAVVVEGQIGCLITDQSMPVTGNELASIAGTIRKDMNIIVLSGHDAPPEQLPEGVTFVRKDDPETLLHAISACMEKWRTD